MAFSQMIVIVGIVVPKKVQEILHLTSVSVQEVNRRQQFVDSVQLVVILAGLDCEGC